MICDSNILIYASTIEDTLCRPFVESPAAMISSVTRIEVLGFPGFGRLSPDIQNRLGEIVAMSVEVALDDSIVRRAIQLRQQKKMSLGDSIVAATALELEVPLVTRNTDDFRHISDLQLINPFG